MNPNMLSVLVGEDFCDERKEFQAKYSLSKNVTSDCPTQYLCYGDKDPLKDMIEYGNTLKKINADFEIHVLPGAGHGFNKDGYDRRQSIQQAADVIPIYLLKTAPKGVCVLN